MNVACSAGDEESCPAAFLSAFLASNLLYSVFFIIFLVRAILCKIGALIARQHHHHGCRISLVDCFFMRFRWARSHALLIARSRCFVTRSRQLARLKKGRHFCYIGKNLLVLVLVLLVLTNEKKRICPGIRYQLSNRQIGGRQLRAAVNRPKLRVFKRVNHESSTGSFK